MNCKQMEPPNKSSLTKNITFIKESWTDGISKRCFATILFLMFLNVNLVVGVKEKNILIRKVWGILEKIGPYQNWSTIANCNAGSCH